MRPADCTAGRFACSVARFGAVREDVTPVIEQRLAACYARVPPWLRYGVFPLLLPLVVYAAVFIRMRPAPTGDEPHYLLIAWSLIEDRDLDLANDYQPPRLMRHLGLASIEPHARDYRGTGELIPYHQIGLSLLLLPGVLVGGLLGARVVAILVAALLAQQVFLLLRDTRLGPDRYIWPVWAATAFCLPLLVYSNQLFPEVPAALLVVVGLRMLMSSPPSPVQLVIASAAAAALPWLHTRYSVLSAGLLVGVAYWLWRRAAWRPRSRGEWGVAWLFKPGTLLPLLPLVVSAGLMVAFALRFYGTPSPTGAAETEGDLWSLSSLYMHSLGAFLNPSVGWLPNAPVHWLGLVGVVPLAARHRRVVPLTLLFVGAYVLLIGHKWGQGWAFPARYLVVVVPLVAVPLLLVVARVWQARVLGAGLLAVSLVIAAQGVRRPQELYPHSYTRPRLPLVSALAPIWPLLPSTPVAVTLSAERMLRRTGEVLPGPPPTLYAAPGRDGPQHLLFGVMLTEQSGYLARFELAAVPTREDAPVAGAEVVDAGGRPTIQWTLWPADFAPYGEFRTRTLALYTSEVVGSQLRLWWPGNAELWLRGVQVTPTQQVTLAPFPALPWMLLWPLGTLFVGLLLVPRGRVATGDG